MILKKYFTLFFIILPIFVFIYTLNLNFHGNNNFNIANFFITLVVLILWLLGWLFLVLKDVLNSPEKERNGIVLALVLSGILFFYYNPFPKPTSFFITIPTEIYFVVTLIVFIMAIFLIKNKDSLTTAILFFAPILIQSFVVNILKKFSFYNDYPYFTSICIFTLLLIVYFVKYSKKKN